MYCFFSGDIKKNKKSSENDQSTGLCILESDTVKSDCPVQIFRKMMNYLKI